MESKNNMIVALSKNLFKVNPNVEEFNTHKNAIFSYLYNESNISL